MIELRVLIVKHGLARLQFRRQKDHSDPETGSIWGHYWSDWEDVPFVSEEDAQPKQEDVK